MSAELAIHGGKPIRSEPFPASPQATDAIRTRVLATLDSGRWWQSGHGSGQVEALEQWLTDFHGVLGAVAVTNGTHALEVAYRAAGVRPGDEVLVPGITFIATASAVSARGATPVPVDVLPGTICMNPADCEAKITERTRVIAPVHLAGQPANMTEIMDIARRHEIAVVEDNAQAIGAEWEGKRTGSFGDLAITSFQAGKLLPAGEGGGITIRDNVQFLRAVQEIVNHGTARGHKWYQHDLVASNYRMAEIPAAIVLAQVDDYEARRLRRQTSAELLTHILKSDETVTPIEVDPRVTRMAWSNYFLRLPKTVSTAMSHIEFASALAAEGVPANVLYPPWYSTRAYTVDRPVGPQNCPEADRAGREVIWLLHTLLDAGEEGVADIAAAIRKVVRWCEANS